MPACLKVVEEYPADYPFCHFEPLSNGFPSPEAHSQQPSPKTIVSLEVFYLSVQVNIGQ